MTGCGVRCWLALSDERDQALARVLAAYQRGYSAGYDDGAAAAAVVVAEMDSRWEATARWRQWAARVKELQQPVDVRINRALAQIKADMKFADQARAKKPWQRSPMEIAVISMAIFDDPGDAA